jgi:hypothetical protein
MLNFYFPTYRESNRSKSHTWAPLNPFQPSKATIHNPIRASGGLKMGNCFLLPYISDSYLPIALIKKALCSPDIQERLKEDVTQRCLDPVRSEVLCVT